MHKNTELLEKGKKRTLYVVISILVFSILGQFLSALAGDHNSIDVARLVLTLVLLHFLYKGHNWARRLTILFYMLGLILCVFYFFSLPEFIVKVIFFIVAIWFIHILSMLRSTPEILAYFGGKDKIAPTKNKKTKEN